MTETVAMATRLESLDAETAAEFLREACRARLASSSLLAGEPLLDRAAIERWLPHRGTFLLVDRVDALDCVSGTIVAAYDLENAADVLRGHFPGRPVWPGVLQVEAIAQAGCILCAATRSEPLTEVAATHILGARFVRPIVPGAPVEIVATGIDDGLFYSVVGQCLQNGEICSAAALSAYVPAT